MSNENEKKPFIEPGHELADRVEDPFIEFLHKSSVGYDSRKLDSL